LRVLFLNPEFRNNFFKPIGISLLSRITLDEGCQVRLFDSALYDLGERGKTDAGVEMLLFKKYRYNPNLTFDSKKNVYQAFKETINEFRPDIVAMSVNYLTYNMGLKVLSSIKKRNFLVIAGGIHCTVDPDNVIKQDCIDILCRGEGEAAFRDLIQTMKKNLDYSRIPNLFVKKENQIIRNEMRPLIANLDDTPYQDWSIYPETHFWKPFLGKMYRGAEFTASRGCYYRCNFCFISSFFKAYGVKNHIRWMSPRRVVNELKYLKDTYGVELIKFRDSNFFARDMQQLRELADLFGKEVKIPFILNTYARVVNEEKVRLIKDMGCLSISVGLETGSSYLRREVLKKHTTNEEFLNAVKIIRKFGIRCTSTNMIGIPHETRKMFFDTIDINRKANIDLADVSVIFPFPGTALRDYAIERGFLNQGDATAGHYYRGEPTMNLDTISKEELMELSKTFSMYVLVPKMFFPLIKLSEKNSALGKWMYKYMKYIAYFYIHVLDLKEKERWIKDKLYRLKVLVENKQRVREVK